uniref:PHTF1/2 N-terminal domain-containing protein n=2 Tax=Octopus bimaculoides TaxID=37653 RepID=A0A0L8FXI7_OCTBM
MLKIHDIIACYQKRIGSYDKQLWEQSVEKKLYKSINNVPRRIGRMKTEFIDVDLVRGSTFTKAKPQVPWTRITQRAVLRVMFFPLYYKW